MRPIRIHTISQDFPTVQEALLLTVRLHDAMVTEDAEEAAIKYLLLNLRAIVASIAARAVPDEAEQERAA